MQLWDIYHCSIPAFLQEAAGTDAMLRLQDIGMNCGCEYTSFPLFNKLSPYSRYDHSMGVALIVWHFTGSAHQTLAALFHDISTPVFAHVVDFLKGDYMTQEATEVGTAQFIQESGQILEILSRYNVPFPTVTDYHLYPIADNETPQLSADRLEYTLGNAVNFGIITHNDAKRIYEDLAVGQNENSLPELMFTRRETGLLFAETALKCSKIYVSDADRYAMQRLAELLRNAISQSILTDHDLYQSEAYVIDKLKRSPLSEDWNAFCNLHKMYAFHAPDECSLRRQIHAKKRYIDPYIKNCGRVSQLYPDYRENLTSFLEASQNQWLLGI